MRLTNIFKPKHKHSDPKIRLAEIKALSNEHQAIIHNAALKDSEAEIRKAALNRVLSVDVLLQASETEADSDNKIIAQNLYNKAAAKIIKKSDALSEVKDYFDKISDDRSYEDIALNAKNAEIRMSALENISKESVVVKVAIQDSIEAVAMAAFNKISKESAFKEIMHSAKVATIRSLASAKNKVLKTEDNSGKDTQIKQKKADVLLSSLKRLVSDSALENKEEFENLKKDWINLDFGDNSEFDKIAQDFKNRCQRLEQEAIEKQKTEEANAEHSEKVNSLYSELEELVNLHLGKEVKIKADEIINQWEELTKQSLDIPEILQKKFEKTINRFKKQLVEDETAEQTAEEDQAHRKEIIEQLESLEEKEDLNSVQKQLHGLTKAWSKLSELATDDSWQLKYDQISEKLYAKIEEISKKHKDELDAIQKSLEEIIEKVKSIDENENFKTISQTLRSLRIEWSEKVGDNRKYFQNLWNDFKTVASKYDEMREWEHWHNERDREQLCESLEDTVATSDGGKDLYDAIRKHQSEWRNQGPISPGRVDELKERFSVACEKGFEKCSEWLETQKVEREENLQSKKTLVERVKEIIASEKESWKDAANEIKDLQNQWREIGPVPHEQSDEIWMLFKKYCDDFYIEHREFLKTEEVQREDNFKLKEKLCEQAEKTASEKRWKEGTDTIKILQQKWKEIGSVPKAKSDDIWNRFRNACDSFFEAKREYFDKIEGEKNDNLLKKTELCEQLENLDLAHANEEMKTKVDQIHSEWKKIGMVSKDDADAVWDRFCAAEDKFYEAYVENNPEVKVELEKSLDAKKEWVDQAQDAITKDNMSETGNLLKTLQNNWKEIGRNGRFDQELWLEFRQICDDFFKRRRDQYEIMEQQRLNNLEKKVLLCEQAEKVVASEDMHEAQKEVKHLRKLWKEVGPVPRKNSDEIWNRFQTACNSVFPKKEEES